MAKFPQVTAPKLIAALGRDGWYETRRRGSHRVFRHPTKPGHVSVPLHQGKTLKTGTLHGILDQAGLTVEELRSLL